MDRYPHSLGSLEKHLICGGVTVRTLLTVTWLVNYIILYVIYLCAKQ